MDKDTIALYPGCSLNTSSSHYLQSLERVFGVMDIPFRIMDNWNCCGATSVKSIDQELNSKLNHKNLALAEKQGIKELVVPCASCYHRLMGTEYELNRDKNLMERLNQESDTPYQGTVKVRNVLDFFVHVTGLEAIARHVKHPLHGLNVACYYGCLNTRVPLEKSFDTREYPVSMDKIVQVLGGNAVNWSYKTDCCGASLFITVKPIAEKLVGKILKDASLRNVDCITVSCPMCQTNLDTSQKAVRQKNDIKQPLPVPFITQLMGLAFGCKPKELGLQKNFVPMRSIYKTYITEEYEKE
ncbi:MAG: CoB--CoM heterodisulfide reductase iron-sulfur subunit B family protein [Bacteroidales bacterium]